MNILRAEAIPSSSGLLLRLAIDERELLDVIREIEAPAATATGEPDLAGGYVYLDLARLPDPVAHFLGEPAVSFFTEAGRTALLVCRGCGEAACWPLEARIEVTEHTVAWHDFRQPHRPRWSYAGLGPFHFQREEYEATLASVRSAQEA